MTLTESLPILVIIIPLISAIIIPLIGRIDKSIAFAFVISANFLSFIISISLLNTVMETGRISYWLGGWEPPWGIEYVVDYLSGFVLVIVSFIAFIISVYAKKSVEMEVEGEKILPFYSIYMLLVTGFMGMIITGDIFNLYVFIEISALAGYALIAIGKKRAALIASYNYLVLGTIGATFILLGIGYLYMATGTLNMADLRERLPMLYDSKVVLTAFAFITVGLSLKLALFPFHIWLPNVYNHAPSVVSALMAATSAKVIAYVLVRIMFSVFTMKFDLEVVPVTKILLFLSVIAIIAGSVLAIAQTNIKRMLAYSSIGQIGYIVLGIAISNQLSMTGSLIHLLNHALMKGTLFLVVGAVVYKTGMEDISSLKGMGKKMPFTMAAFTIGALSMIGVPLTVGFVSKWYLALGALKAGMWFLVFIILVSSLLNAVYFWRVIEGIYFHQKPKVRSQKSTTKDSIESLKPEIQNQDDAPVGMLIPTLILAGLCIVFGIAAFIPVSVVTPIVNMLLEV
ncbi:MAG: cation:proton antiporter [Nitrospinae bacterium]|jgi:multicomponent Na+:H+ antiporter subunit D|nr:cation:proton antiporter [Nitrospinota bacterium]MDP7581460.1 monovalent cation/H+ antiporter subunit D family protein [Nitrospinota bacterium]HJN03263.1 monovalent cation/H+ antiporter subunit D family protein [Nitrospinota bacterium]|tara:strand:- start:3863 stop:5398 length:1536 start_codon:yes stop_codon:yes gene_type:complete